MYAPKHKLWVLVRTASPRRFLRVPTIYGWSTTKKNIKYFLLKIFIFHNFKNICILHGHVFVMIGPETESLLSVFLLVQKKEGVGFIIEGISARIFLIHFCKF